VPKLDLSRIDPVFYPRLKLFLSADIIGSTAYKQPLDIVKDAPEDHALWADIIQGFYKTIDEAFGEHWQNAYNTLKSNPKARSGSAALLLGPRPRFWKTIGDEVVFWKELTNSLQVWFTLACWLKTIESVRKFFPRHRDESANRLDVKCAAWIAGFPVRNRVVLDLVSKRKPGHEMLEQLAAFYTESDEEDCEAPPTADFIGPGIDVGFRICGFASARKMSIGLDVAYVLAKSRVKMRRKAATLGLLAEPFFPKDEGAEDVGFTDRLSVHYSGGEELKGVLGGIHYPKFWISALHHGSLEQAKVALYSRGDGRRVSWGPLEIFCERFYDDRRKFVSKPFIHGDSILNEIAPRYQEFLDVIGIVEPIQPSLPLSYPGSP